MLGFIRFPMLLVSAILVFSPTMGAGADWVPLFNGKDLTGWNAHHQDGAKVEDVWSVQDGVLHCKGRPIGYILTQDEFENFELALEWRWPEGTGRNANSGVFVWVVGPDKVWPKGVEAQLQSGAAGDFWLVDGAELTIDPKRQDPGVARHYFRYKEPGQVEKPIGEWNQYLIICKDGKVTLEVNGTEVNVGTDAKPRKGKILLQSEGSPIEFRNIRIRTFD